MVFRRLTQGTLSDAKLGEVTSILRTVFVPQLREIADSMIGIPYVHLGRDPKVGLDCYGAVLEFYRRLGSPLSEVFFSYELDWWRTKNYVLEHDQDFFRVPIPVPGGVVALHTPDSTVPNHLVVVLDSQFVMNTSERIGVHRLRLFAIKPSIVVSYQRKDLRVL